MVADLATRPCSAAFCASQIQIPVPVSDTLPFVNMDALYGCTPIEDMTPKKTKTTTITMTTEPAPEVTTKTTKTTSGQGRPPKSTAGAEAAGAHGGDANKKSKPPAAQSKASTAPKSKSTAKSKPKPAEAPAAQSRGELFTQAAADYGLEFRLLMFTQTQKRRWQSEPKTTRRSR